MSESGRIESIWRLLEYFIIPNNILELVTLFSLILSVFLLKSLFIQYDETPWTKKTILLYCFWDEKNLRGMKIFLKIIRGLKISGTKNKGYEIFLDFCRKSSTPLWSIINVPPLSFQYWAYFWCFFLVKISVLLLIKLLLITNRVLQRSFSPILACVAYKDISFEEKSCTLSAKVGI